MDEFLSSHLTDIVMHTYLYIKVTENALCLAEKGGVSGFLEKYSEEVKKWAAN